MHQIFQSAPSNWTNVYNKMMEEKVMPRSRIPSKGSKRMCICYIVEQSGR